MRDGGGVQDALHSLGQGPTPETYWGLGAAQLDESPGGIDDAALSEESGLVRGRDLGHLGVAAKGTARPGCPRLLALVSLRLLMVID